MKYVKLGNTENILKNVQVREQILFKPLMGTFSESLWKTNQNIAAP